ncbi:uncharacterized protein DS421_11g330890 [Arachis hypogaea]|nr:uncharacterized protein DS421_11g330890 [Arachis hypogaea]
MDLRLAVDPRLAATASMSSNSATIAAVDRDQRGARDRERVRRGDGVARRGTRRCCRAQPCVVTAV